MELTELQQCVDEESAAELVGNLNRSEISYSRSEDIPSFDVTSLGTTGGSGNAKIIISVPSDQFSKARAAMEVESLKTDLPADHYLHQSSVEDLQDILYSEREWSAFDVAHAKRLLSEQGIETPDPDAIAAGRTAALREGKPASPKLLFIGWFFVFTGGLIGMGIGWSLCSMKEETPEGEFHVYNREAQATGKRMMSTGVLVIVGINVLASYLTNS